MNRDDRQLDELFAADKRACHAPAPGAGLMPALWGKIDARRSFMRSLRRWTGGFLTAAVVVCLLMVVYLAIPRWTEPPLDSTTYVDALEGNGSPEMLAYADWVNYEPSQRLGVR